MSKSVLAAAIAVALLTVPVYTTATSTELVLKTGNVSPLLDDALDLGAAVPTQEMRIVWALDLRNRADLDQFLVDVQDPASPLFHQFLTSEQFNALYAPTPGQEAQVVDYLTSAGFSVTQTFGNRLLVEATAPVATVDRAFAVDVHVFLYDGKLYLASVDEPSVPAAMAPYTVGILGLGDVGERKPMHTGEQFIGFQPNDNLGSNCCYFSPRDLNVAYNEDHNGAHTGAGQVGIIAGAYDFKDTDMSAFNTQMGLPSTSITRVCVYSGGALPLTCKFNTQNSIEISLDIEYIHGTAPGATLWSYMAKSTAFTDFTTMENRVVSDNRGHAVSESWGACENAIAASTITAEDNAFANGAAVGQSWFFASGDSGSNDCSGALGVDYPAASSYTTGVGGTHLTCSSGMTPSQPVCGGYGSETGWSGSGGGFSTKHSKPAWQTGCNVPADGHRDVPDIALESDTSPGNLVAKGGGWYAVGGTSDAAPQLAGMFTALNAAKGAQGLANARFYALCGGNTFHDITSGSNGAYSAGVNYDMVTGLGTINEGNLITNW